MASPPEPADAANPSTVGSGPLSTEHDTAAYRMHPFTDDEMALREIACWPEPEDWSDWLQQPDNPTEHDTAVPSSKNAPA